MSSLTDDRAFSAMLGQAFYAGGELPPYIMNLDIYVQSKMVYIRDPPVKDDELDTEALLVDGSIELKTPVKTLFMPRSRLPNSKMERLGVIMIPPGGHLSIKGVWIHNGGEEDQAAYAFCPKCSNWWIKKTPERPKRCPECNARLEKYRDEEIELKEVMKQGKKILRPAKTKH